MTALRRLLRSDGPAAAILVRLMVGAVFLSEGIQKLLFPDALGVGRFAKIGLPSPEALAPFVGVVEIICGGLLLAGLLTRMASLPVLVVIATAIVTTKLPMLGKDGFWSMAHEARTDFSMLLGLVFLVIEGGGPWSADARLLRGRRQARHQDAPGS